jgi:hypothetical protein
MVTKAEAAQVARVMQKWGMAAPGVHTHTISQVTGLQAALDASGGGGPHVHAISEVTGLQAALNAKASVTELGDAMDSVTTALAGKAAASHGHSISDTSGLQAALDAKAASSHTHTTANVTGLDAALAGKSDSGHTHSAATTGAAGFMSVADKSKLDGVATGATANATDANLRDRATHTGAQAISTVTGLQTALDAKSATGHGHAISDTTGLQTALDGKQATLVSGTNIKTVGGVSLLGSGDVPAGGGGGASLVSAFLTSTQANSTVTPAVLTGHTFTLTPGQSLLLNGQVVCTAAATTTGFAIGVRVAQANGAGGNVVGSAMLQVAIANAAAATQLYDADKFDVAANASALLEILGTASTAGNNGGSYQVCVKNNGTSGVATVTVEFRSEVATSAVTAQIGTGCVGVKG